MPLSPVTEREQALGKWIDEQSLKLAGDNDRKQVTLLCHAAMVLAADDDNDPYVPDPAELRTFTDKLIRGAKARGARRGEAAVGAGYAALAAVIAATRGA